MGRSPRVRSRRAAWAPRSESAAGLPLASAAPAQSVAARVGVRMELRRVYSTYEFLPWVSNFEGASRASIFFANIETALDAVDFKARRPCQGNIYRGTDVKFAPCGLAGAHHSRAKPSCGLSSRDSPFLLGKLRLELLLLLRMLLRQLLRLLLVFLFHSLRLRVAGFVLRQLLVLLVLFLLQLLLFLLLPCAQLVLLLLVFLILLRIA